MNESSALSIRANIHTHTYTHRYMKHEGRKGTEIILPFKLKPENIVFTYHIVSTDSNSSDISHVRPKYKIF